MAFAPAYVERAVHLLEFTDGQTGKLVKGTLTEVEPCSSHQGIVHVKAEAVEAPKLRNSRRTAAHNQGENIDESHNSGPASSGPYQDRNFDARQSRNRSRIVWTSASSWPSRKEYGRRPRESKRRFASTVR